VFVVAFIFLCFKTKIAATKMEMIEDPSEISPLLPSEVRTFREQSPSIGYDSTVSLIILAFGKTLRKSILSKLSMDNFKIICILRQLTNNWLTKG